MTAVQDARAVKDKLVSYNPATGEPLAEYPIQGEKEIAEALGRARDAAAWWAGLGFAERRARMLAWKKVIVSRLEEFTELIHAETGKPHGTVKLEIAVAVSYLDWAARNAQRVLSPRRIPAGLFAFNHAASVEYQPLGVVGVIAPWNYPVYTPAGSAGFALAAGNAVILKPSEYTTGVGRWLVETFTEVVPERPVLQLITGYGETGAALCRSGVDKIAFTGSTATGKKVMAACAENLVPVVLECGGKDAAIVAADADVDAAAESVLFGAMVNTGQTCVGIERVYVEEPVYEAFVSRISEMARKIRLGDQANGQLGPMTMPSQINVVRRHIEDALARGGRAVVGGPESVREPYCDPVILVDVPEDSEAIREETFGPTLTITKVRDIEDAVAKSNALSYGLAGSVFSRNRDRAMDVARRMRTGATAINSVLTFGVVPAMPFGGTGQSGFGRIHGDDGLREFARAKGITRQRFAPPLNLLSFEKGDRPLELAMRLFKLVHGR